MTWLKTELTASTAIFKVLVAGSGWNKGKGVGEDSWAAFLHERNKIFDFIRDHEISGVVLLSGDTHVGELNVIPWSETGGYDYYDFGSSGPGNTGQLVGASARKAHPVRLLSR